MPAQMKWLATFAGLLLGLSACAESKKPIAPLLLQMTAPAGYTHASVILISDPNAAQELVWAGSLTHITVPKSGIVRLKSLGAIDSYGIEAQLDGKDYWRVGSANLHGARVAMFRFWEDSSEPAIDLLLESELERYLDERESAPKTTQLTASRPARQQQHQPPNPGLPAPAPAAAAAAPQPPSPRKTTMPPMAADNTP